MKERVIPSPLEVLLSVVPKNPFASLAEGKVLQIIFFSALRVASGPLWDP